MRYSAASFICVIALTGISPGQQPERPQEAQAKPAPIDEFGRPVRVRTELEWTDYVPMIALIAVLLIGAIVLAIANRWLKRSRESDVTVNDHLTEFRRLKAQGELSDEEFQKIKGVLGEKIRKEVGLDSPQPPSSDDSADEDEDNREA